jgi:hypothetical protein
MSLGAMMEIKFAEGSLNDADENLGKEALLLQGDAIQNFKTV